MHMLELAERGGVPCGWILEIVARQRERVPFIKKGHATYKNNQHGSLLGSLYYDNIQISLIVSR